jgi:hypothetical protein
MYDQFLIPPPIQTSSEVPAFFLSEASYFPDVVAKNFCHHLDLPKVALACLHWFSYGEREVLKELTLSFS